MSVQLSTGCGQTCGNPNPCSTDKIDMNNTQIAIERLSNIIAQVIKGRITEGEANQEAISIVTELKVALASE
jgi:hypothetical protein